jgi:hypothetical protein
VKLFSFVIMHGGTEASARSHTAGSITPEESALAYAPSLHAECVSVNAQPAETPGARSLSSCPACRSELSNSVETPRATVWAL